MGGRAELRVRVDASRCQGHGRCRALAPDLFALDDTGQAEVLGSGAVADASRSRALLAVRNCPERAVELVGLESRSSSEAP